MPNRLQLRTGTEAGRQTIYNDEFEPCAGRVTVIRSLGDPRIPENTGRVGWGDLLDQLAVAYASGQGRRMFQEPWVEATTVIVKRTLDGDTEFRPSSDVAGSVAE